MSIVADPVSVVNRTRSTGRQQTATAGVSRPSSRRPAAATGATAQPAPPLGNNTDKSSPKPATNRPRPRSTPGEKRKRRSRRRNERYELRHGIREVTTLKRVRKCGWCTINGDGGNVGLRLGSQGGLTVARLEGLAVCGSPWACPVCGASIATQRASELADVMRYADEQGCTATMVTLTMRHHKGQSLEDGWQALTKAWGSVTSGKTWNADREEFGLIGFVRAVEVTYGDNGWHPHLHALLIWKNDGATKLLARESDQGTSTAAEFVVDRMWERWNRSLQRSGFESIRDSGGLDVRVATLDPEARGGNGIHEYFVKLAHELTGGGAKVARGHGRTPFQLVADAIATGDKDDLALWHEWERVSKGRRSISWSEGLRSWAKLRPELTDQQVAERHGQDVAWSETRLVIEGYSWTLLRTDWSMVCHLLVVAERRGLGAAGALLDRWCMDWWRDATPVAPPPPRERPSEIASPDLEQMFPTTDHLF